LSADRGTARRFRVAATGLYVQLATWPPEGRRECISLLATRSKPGSPANG